MKIPLLVGVGDQDELFAVDSVKESYEGIDCADKEFFVAKGARHATFPGDAWGPLLGWLAEKF